MNNQKILLLPFFLCFCFLAVSQQINSPQNKSSEIEIRTKQRMIANLKLTELQAENIISIQKKYTSSIEKIKSDTSLSAQSKEQQVRLLKNNMFNEIVGIVGLETAKKIENYHHHLNEDALIID